MQIEVLDQNGKAAGKTTLNDKVWKVNDNPDLVAQVLNVYMSNQRKGTAHAKTRGDVSGGGRKPWKQKGTGRARHGSRKAPIFVGGGVAFGPRPRDYSLKMPKKMKKAALFSALSYKQNNGEIKVVRGFEKLLPKTKFMAHPKKCWGVR